MKILLWVCVAVLRLMWTGLAAIGAGLVGWGAGVLASGGVAEWARVAHVLIGRGSRLLPRAGS